MDLPSSVHMLLGWKDKIRIWKRYGLHESSEEYESAVMVIHCLPSGYSKYGANFCVIYRKSAGTNFLMPIGLCRHGCENGSNWIITYWDVSLSLFIPRASRRAGELTRCFQRKRKPVPIPRSN
jgi:hypothetical protein